MKKEENLFHVFQKLMIIILIFVQIHLLLFLCLYLLNYNESLFFSIVNAGGFVINVAVFIFILKLENKDILLTKFAVFCSTLIIFILITTIVYIYSRGNSEWNNVIKYIIVYLYFLNTIVPFFIQKPRLFDEVHSIHDEVEIDD